jgi:hypothetical protein
MVEKPLHPTLRLGAGIPSGLRSGELVSVQVLKRLSGSKWAVGIKGRVVPAVSDLKLVSGQRLRARVQMQDGRVLLRLQETRSESLDGLLRRAGLPLEPDVRQIVDSFLRSGLGIRNEQVNQARRLLERTRLAPRRFARLIALAAEKGIDLQSPGLEELLPLLGYGEGGEGRRRYNGRRMPDQQQQLQDELGEALLDPEGREGDSALPVFNHLRGRDGTWLVIPFHFIYPSGGHLFGTLRLLYDETTKTSKRFVLVVEKEGNEEAEATEAQRRWSFSLDPDEDGYKLGIFCNRPETGASARGEIRQLGLKLQNLGVKIDDTIRVDDGFDGFSPPEDAPAYRSVDLER